MKKLQRLLVLILALSFLFSMSAFAVENRHDETVGVIVEYVEGMDFTLEYDYDKPIRARASVVDLSQGSSSFSVGTLSAGSTYTTDTYIITKSTIRIGLQSLNGASPHIKIYLYDSSGVNVAVTTVSLPSSTPLGAATYVSFTNLNTAKNYYAVIENMDTVSTGSIIGGANQR